jgi:hypothetical protein
MADDYGLAGYTDDSGIHPEELADGSTVALITLSSTGKIRTAASGQRVEMVATSGEDMWLAWAGVANETPAYIAAIADGSIPVFWLYSGKTTALSVRGYLGVLPGASTPTVVTKGIFRPNSDLDGALGEPGHAWATLYVAGIYDEADNLVIDTSKYTKDAWTPTWKGSTSDPTMTHTSGQYVRNGYMVNAVSVDEFTATVGSGFYYLTLPVDASTSCTAVGGSETGTNLGTATLYDANGNTYVGSVHLRSASGTDTAFVVFSGSPGRWSDSDPITPAAGDVVMVNLNYPVD